VPIEVRPSGVAVQQEHGRALSLVNIVNVSISKCEPMVDEWVFGGVDLERPFDRGKVHGRI
jgi:hypothetical protein